jgi:hypothetical protein
MRNYKAKRSNNYSIETLQEAIHAVLHGRMNVSAAARLFGVPRMTLNNHVTGRNHGNYFFIFLFKHDEIFTVNPNSVKMFMIF